jgi:alkylglycerol monooxygenase
MNVTLLQYAIPVFFTLIFIEALYSHVKGLDLYNLRNSLSCLGCGMFTTTLEIFIKAGLVALYIVIYDNFSLTELADNSWITWIAGLVLFDFLWYWAHRKSHEINILWAGHVPHHQSEEFNLTAGLRQGALQDFMYWPFYLIMAVLGFSAEMFVAQMLINKFYGFWLHTRAIGKLPLIEGILGTPSAHRVHHGMNDQYIDKNHGGIFMVFDRMFGTYQEENEDVIYGVRKRYTSFNPVMAHFDWMHSMWKDARLAGSKWDKVRIWFMPTGWRPDDVASKDPRQKFNKDTYVKFDAKPEKYPYRLALALFVLLAAANHTLILQSESLSWEHKGMLVVLITLGLYWMGRLLNASTRITKRVENSLADKA